jgi:hypothetical protein
VLETLVVGLNRMSVLRRGPWGKSAWSSVRSKQGCIRTVLVAAGQGFDVVGYESVSVRLGHRSGSSSDSASLRLASLEPASLEIVSPVFTLSHLVSLDPAPLGFGSSAPASVSALVWLFASDAQLDVLCIRIRNICSGFQN